MSEPILQVIVEGRQGFEPAALEAAERIGSPAEGKGPEEWSGTDWKEKVDTSNALDDIQGATAGVLNHLLDALARPTPPTISGSTRSNKSTNSTSRISFWRRRIRRQWI